MSIPLHRLTLGKDYVMEGNKVVFLEAYHKRRGYCCGTGNGCKYCPYNHENVKNK